MTLMALALNEPQRLNEVLQKGGDERVPSSVIRGGVVMGGEMGAFVKARQEAVSSG